MTTNKTPEPDGKPGDTQDSAGCAPTAGYADYDFGTEIEMKHGSIPLLKIAVGALHQLLVKKGIVTTEELRESFEEMAALADEHAGHNAGAMPSGDGVANESKLKNL